MAADQRKIWQPLHPDVRQRLDPEYVAFHDQYMQYVQPDNTKIWDGTARTQPSLPPGGLPPLSVGHTEDFEVGRFRARAYTPKGESHSSGLPVFIWFHGGGWAIGGLGDNKDFCTRVCQEAQCVVITIDYRLAPEHPFPVAVEDAVDAVRWIMTGPSQLGNIDTSKIALGGTSAGANLAVVAALATTGQSVDLPRAKPSLPSSPKYPLLALLLIVPVIDNTATVEGIWQRNAVTAPWLTPERMEWYRKLYFVNAEDRNGWDASPQLAPEELLSQLPATWMAVSEQDLLAPEAEAFAEQLRGLGVKVDMNIIEGGTHSILTLGGQIQRGRRLMDESARHLHDAFYS